MHTFSVGTSHGQPWTHLTHHGPDSKEATTFPHIIFSAALHRTYIQMVIFPRTPKVESRKCLDLDSWDFWAFITSHPELGSGRGLNQSYISPRELFKGVSHFIYMHWYRVDSRLLMIGSQIGNLTLGPSFDHNLCCRCPNGSCEAILNIYTSRPFQRYKERFNKRCFGPCNCALSFWESWGTPKSHFRECEWRPHTSLKVGLRHKPFGNQKFLMFNHTSSPSQNFTFHRDLFAKSLYHLCTFRKLAFATSHRRHLSSSSCVTIGTSSLASLGGSCATQIMGTIGDLPITI